jgi:beta-lactamase regulating signal transducer with metallopeptidase domain
MNGMQLLFAQPWVDRLGWTLIHFLWQGATIAAIYLLARRYVRAVNARYLLACTALAAMTAAPLITFLVAGSGSNSQALATATAVSGPPRGGFEMLLPAPELWQRIAPWLVGSWFAGVIAFSVRLIGGWLVATQLRFTAARTVPGEWQQLFEKLAQQIGVTRPVSLLVSSAVEVPSVIGWLRPAIVTPVSALAGLPAGYLEALLAHELAHVRRHDFLVNMLQKIVETLLFYHPAVWWVSKQIRIERELCCDDLAVASSGDVLTYARALAELESGRPAHTSLAVAASGGSLANRIRRLLAPLEGDSHALPGWGAASITSLLIIGGIFVVAKAQEPKSIAEPSISRDAIWVDTVKQGDLALAVRASGVVKTPKLIQFTLPEEQKQYLNLGSIELNPSGNNIYHGRLVRITSRSERMITADVEMSEIPSDMPVGTHLEPVLRLGTLTNVVYVGRPVSAQPDAAGSIFKLDPDGKQATRVTVRYGRVSVNAIQILSGLAPGDKVILSDTSALSKYDRIVVQ